MKKEMNELPPGVQARIRALETLPEAQIDTSDAPEVLDWSDAPARSILPACKAADYAKARRGHHCLVQGPRPWTGVDTRQP